MGSIKTTLVLTALLILLVSGNLIVSNSRKQKTESDFVLKGAIFPELNIDDVSKIEMTRGEDKLTLERSDNDWLIQEQFGYPAKATMTHTLLESMRRYNSATVFSDKPAQHAEFACTEDTGVVVNVYSGDKIVANFIAGKPSFTPTTGYIRKVDDNRVLEVYGNTSQLFNPRAKAWLDTKLFNVSAESIYSIKVSSAGTSPYELTLVENNWKFVPDSVETPNLQSIKGLLANLAGITLKEVVSGIESLVERQLDPPLWEIEFTTEGGDPHKLRIGKKRDKMSCFVSFDEMPFVLVVDSRIVDAIMLDRNVVVRGPQAKPEDKQPHPSRYAVEGKGQPLPQVKMITNKGEILIELWEDDAPNTVSNFIYLIEKGFYNGLTFHRFEPGLVLQGGDPNGNGSGGPGWAIEGEISRRTFDDGVIGMADSGVDTAGSQFFFAMRKMPGWDNRYTNFGKIIKGIDVFRLLEKGDSIVTMEVVSKRDHDYHPFVIKDGSNTEERLPALKK